MLNMEETIIKHVLFLFLLGWLIFSPYIIVCHLVFCEYHGYQVFLVFRVKLPCYLTSPPIPLKMNHHD